MMKEQDRYSKMLRGQEPMKLKQYGEKSKRVRSPKLLTSNKNLYSRTRLISSLLDILKDKDDYTFLDIMCKTGIVNLSMIERNENTCYKCGVFIDKDSPAFNKRFDNECDNTEYPMGLSLCKKCHKKK